MKLLRLYRGWFYHSAPCTRWSGKALRRDGISGRTGLTLRQARKDQRKGTGPYTRGMFFGAAVNEKSVATASVK